MVVSDQNEHHHCHGTDTTETDGSCRSKCFDNFVQAQTCHQTFSTFHALCQAIDIEYPPAQSSCDHITFYPRLKKQLGDSWRAQSLWGKLDKRFYGKEYFFNSKMNRPGGTRIGEDTKILIIGAGPCGLRTAIEMACLGAKTIVVEKRDVFSRNNVLHLWPFIITDLKALGAKKFYGRFCAGAIDHISIRQLQLILLKTSLLLGVEVVVNVSFESLSIPSDPVICDDGTVHQKGWTASVKPSDHPLAKYEFDVIVGADGKRNTLQGFKRKEFRGKLAIGLTANFINRNTSAEAKVEEISGVAYIFNQEFFKNLRRTTHIDLENIVYYKGETHYFVMTAKKHSLIAKGVLRQDYDDTKSLLCYQNVDQQALTLYAMEAADFSTNHKLPNLEFAINQYGEPDVALFDFTCMYAAENAGLFREIKGQKLLSSLVGDSLLEPFWPMGTGCARGFFAAFDLVWMTRRWCLLTQSSNDNQTAVEKGNSIELEVLAERESIYRLLHHTTPQNTVKKWANYTIDPNTRYPNLNLKMVSTKQVAPLYLSDQHHGDEAQEQEKTSNQNGPATSHAESRRPLNSALTRKVSIIRSNKLMTWCRRITENYEAVHITDMSSSWRSGLALCAIIHQFRPDLIKWEELHPIDIEVNNQLAFDLAEKHFGISPVMTGKEMATCDEVDKLVMVTYISQFYEVFKNEKPVGAVAIKNSGDSLETPGAQGGPKSPLSSTSPVGLLIRFTNHIKRKSVNGKHEEQVKKKKYGGLFRRKSSSSAPEAIPEDENKENESKDDPKAQSSVMQIGGAEVRLRSKKGAQSQEGSVRVPGVNQRASDRISALSSQLMSQFVQNGALREMPASDKCYFCQKRVYIAERMSAEGLFFHSKCFVCCHCGITLRRGNYEYVSETGKFYCRAHYFAHSDMFKQAGSKAGRKKYGADGMDSASTNAPGLTDTLRNEEVKPTEKFLTPERIELANIRMSMLNHPEELSEEAQTQHNLSGLQQGKNSPIQEDDFMSESSDEDVDWEAVLKEANEQGRNDPDESDLDTDDERADDSLISQSSSRGCNDVTAVSWLNDTCLADEPMTNEQLLDDQRTLSDMSDCEENLEELTNGHHSAVSNGNDKPPFECKRCRHMRLKSDPEIKVLPEKADSADESDSDSSDDSMSDSSVATVDFGTDEASSFFPIATPRNSLKPPKPTTLPRSKRPSAMSLPNDDKAFGETFQGIGVASEILKPSRDNEEEPQECLFLSLAEMEVERQRLCSLPPKPAKCPVVYMPKQELAKLTNASAKDPSSHEAIQKWLLSSVDVPGMREPQQNGRQPVELYSTSVASSLEGSDNDQVKTRRSLSSSSSATDSLVDPDPAAKYGELRANSQTAPVGMETVGTGFFSPEKSNVNIAEVETEQKTKEDDAEEKSDELSSLSTASPSNIPDVSMSEPDSDDETPARVEPEVGEEPKDPPEISAESQTGEKAISDVPSAPPARKPRTIFNLLSSPVEPEQPALSSATPYQEETVSEEVSELELPKRVRSSKDMRRLDTLDRVQQYLLQNPMDIDYERSQDKEDDALSTASSATSTSDLNTAQFDVEDLLEDNSNNKSSLPLSASVVARSAAIGSTTNATSSNQARPLPRPVSIQGVHVGASASTARNNTSVWSNLADDTTSSEVEPPSGGDRGKSFSESYISSYRPGQESWSDEHEKRPKPPAPERSTSYDSLELRMKMRLKARNQWFQQESDQAMQLKRATSENSDQDEERVSSERCEAPSSPAGASWQTASDIELVGEQSLLAYTPATPSAPLAASLDSDNDQFFTPIAKTPVRPQQDKDISTPLSARSPPQLGNLTMSTTHDTTGDFVSPQGTPSTVPRRLPSVPSTTNRRSLPALPTVPHLEALSPTWQSPQTKPSVEEELRTREMRVKERVAKMKAQTAKKRNSMSSKSESNRTSSSFDDAEVGVGKKSQSSASDDVTAAANPTGQVEPTYSGVSPKPKRRTSFRQKLRKMHKRKEESNDPSSKVKRTLPVPNAAPQRTRESASPVEMAHSDADKKKKKKIKIKKTKGKTVSSRTESSADSGDLRKSSPGKSAKALFRMSPSKKDRKLVGNSTFYDGESTLERKYKTDSDRERAILRGERVRFLPDVPDSAHTSRDRQDSYDSIEKDATLTKQPRRKRRSTLAGYTPEQIEAKITRRVQIAARRQAKMEAQKRLRRAQVIQRQLEEVEVKQRELEERGVRLEKLLREEGERKSREESASMQEWFQLVQEKNALLRYENELMIYQRELQLEDVQSHLQQELRERMAMEDKRKTSAQLAQEKEILQKMLEVVEQRDELVGLLEEQRIKEKVEMVDIETLMLSKFNTFSNQDQSADASSDSVTSSPRSAPVSS